MNYIIIIFNRGCTKFLMFYLITGENTTLIEDEIENIEQKFNNIPFEKVNAKTSFETFIFNTESCDMFSPQKGQFIHEPNWFKKTTKSQQATFEHCKESSIANGIHHEKGG